MEDEPQCEKTQYQDEGGIHNWIPVVQMTFIIAEAGVNHGGSYERAQRLVDAAKAANADAVKFQLFRSQDLWGDDRIAHLELSADHMAKVYDHCIQVGIEFLCTPFGITELAWVKKHCASLKIASGCITRHDLLRAAKATGLPVILSTGMATYDDIRSALLILGKEMTTLLHCTSAYPAPPDQLNLRAMEAMRYFGCPVGYSDHADGILASVAAAAMGAEVIEKHLTLDRNAVGPDHKASIEPDQFALMAKQIRLVEMMLGSREKYVQPCEMPVYQQWRAQ